MPLRKRGGVATLPYADEMDLELHPARIGNRGEKVTYEATLGSLPDGCFVQFGGRPHVVQGGALLLWTPEHYSKREAVQENLVATVLTPKPIVECFRQGYVPLLHESARTL